MTTPIIVISSSHAKSGKTTLALNLAAALWSDAYQVMLYAPHNTEVHEFMRRRRAFIAEKQLNLPLPKLIEAIPQEESAGKNVIIVDVPTDKNADYSDVFAKAHTLITIEKKVADFQWKYSDAYMSLIWNAKKDIAAQGIKYLNWIAVLNQTNSLPENEEKSLQEAANKFGFRAASPLHDRKEFQHIKDGFCAADMVCDGASFGMTLADVYARREILTLTDFLWQKK